MNLIPISPNVLINPDAITCLEQRIVKGTEFTYVWVGDKHYILNVPIEDFYKSLESHGEIKQNFAG